MSDANSKQVGGNHYKQHGATGEQHWDRQYRLFGPGYFVGCITKYVERYKDKNGKQDLEKAIHFIEKLIELEYPEKKEPRGTYTVSPGAVIAHSKYPNSTITPLHIDPMVSDHLGYATAGYVNQDR